MTVDGISRALAEKSINVCDSGSALQSLNCCELSFILKKSCLSMLSKYNGRLGLLEKKKMPFNFPILLTWLRVALIPLVVGVFYVPNHYASPSDKNVAATVVFIVAAVTDWFDGFLARRWNQTSAFGAFGPSGR